MSTIIDQITFKHLFDIFHADKRKFVLRPCLAFDSHFGDVYLILNYLSYLVLFFSDYLMKVSFVQLHISIFAMLIFCA